MSLHSNLDAVQPQLDAHTDDSQLVLKSAESWPSDRGHASALPKNIPADATMVEKEDAHRHTDPKRTTDTDPRDEIVALFNHQGLPELVALKLVDPEGDYDFSDLVSFVQLVTFEDLIAAGLKVCGARKLIACIKPGGWRVAWV